MRKTSSPKFKPDKASGSLFGAGEQLGFREPQIFTNRTNPREIKTIAPRSHVLGRCLENRAFAHRARAKHCLAVGASLRNGATPARARAADP